MANISGTRRIKKDDKLLQRFVATFERLDDMTVWDSEAVTVGLTTYFDDDPHHTEYWRPTDIATPVEALSVIHTRVGGVLPHLYEQLVLSYRWLEVNLGLCRLLANPPEPGLQTLCDRMFADPVMNHSLIPARFVRFALGPDVNYDPICFDLNRFARDDCPIVRFNHEAILCNDDLSESETIFSSFRELIYEVLDSTE